MKVALISYHSFIQPGGVKRHILGLYQEFKKRGILTKIIAPRRKAGEDYGKDVVLLGTSFPLPFSGVISDFALNFNPPTIEELLEKEKFDVLHFHNFGISAFQILEHSESLNILTFHANLQGNRFVRNFPIFMDILEKAVEWKIDGIIGVAAFNLRYFKNYSGPKIVIPNGLDLKRFNPGVPKLKKPVFGKDDRLNILFLGRIEERKGLIYLLKAYKILQNKFSNIRLIVGGEGPLRGKLEQWAKTNNLRNVFFQGRIDENEVPSYYRICDIFCSPAIFGESFGLVLTEAMACGKPVAAFSNEGYRTVLTGKGAEFSAKPKDYKALAQKLEVLLRDKNLRKEMGEWGIKEARKYSWQKVGDRILDFYQLCREHKTKREKEVI